MASKFTFRSYYTPQVDERDCGVAALDMILKYYHSDYSLAHLRQLAKTNLDGTTALGLVKAAQKLNFDVKPIRADIHLFNESDLPFPFIAHVEKKGGILHYYVVFAISGNSLIIGDPDPTVKIIKMPIKTFASEWTGVAIFFAPNTQYVPKKENKHSLYSFVPLVLKQHKLIINIILSSIMITLISIIGSYFIQIVIDTYIPMAMMGTLEIVAIGLIIAYFFQATFTFSQNFLLTILGQRLSIDITLGYIQHLFKLPMSFFSTRRTGEIVSRFTDASKIIDALASTILSMFLDIWIVLGVGTVLAIQNVHLFAMTLIAVPFYIIVILIFQRPFEKMNRDAMESNAKLSSSIIEDLNGIETIKSLTSEQQSYMQVDIEFADLLKKSFKYQRADQLQQALKQGIKLTLNIVVLWYGAKLVMSNALTIGQLLTFNALLVFFTEPLENIINLQPKLQMAKVANNRLDEVYLVESEFLKKRSVKKRDAIVGDISVHNLNFNYGYGANTLTNINLSISLGDKLTIIGMSGSGKTTLVKLLIGLYPVKEQSGAITFNGINSEDIDLSVLRSYIMYVPQDPVIFSGSVSENLCQGATTVPSYQTICEACKAAEILDDILKLPEQFETDLSENGSILSGGQRQRISIARALLSSAQVIIFDESTSNLDTITERKLVDNLLALKDKTIIFVAHRLTISEKTNNVVVLDHGRIVEMGTHAQLLAQHGYYSNLVKE